MERGSTVSKGNKPTRDGASGSPPSETTGHLAPDALDGAISSAKREAAAARIRAIREAGQQRIAERFRAHLDDHGDEHVTSAADFLRETKGNGSSKD